MGKVLSFPEKKVEAGEPQEMINVRVAEIFNSLFRLDQHLKEGMPIGEYLHCREQIYRTVVPNLR